MYRTVSYTGQSADFEAFVLEQSAHFAIPPFVQLDPKPRVAALVRLERDAVEAGGPVLEHHALAEAIEDVGRRHAPQPHAVLALDLARGMHEAARALAVVREEQQAGGIHVQPPDHDPTAASGGWQPVEDGRPIFRVAARRDL